MREGEEERGEGVAGGRAVRGGEKKSYRGCIGGMVVGALMEDTWK